MGRRGDTTDGGEAVEVYVFLGPVSGATGAAAADVTMACEAHGAYAGSYVALVGDSDGDATDDLLVGSSFGDGFHVAWFVSGAEIR